MDSSSPFAQQQMAQDILVNVGPNGVNQLHTMKCNSCWHQWVQPAGMGRCPMCKDDDTISTEFRTNALPRV